MHEQSTTWKWEIQYLNHLAPKDMTRVVKLYYVFDIRHIYLYPPGSRPSFMFEALHCHHSQAAKSFNLLLIVLSILRALGNMKSS